MPSDDFDMTIAATRAATRSPGSPGSAPSSTSTLPWTPGAIIAGRYRLVSLLGRGGMGEVYRADDLTLDQPIALKFLPAGVAADSDRLAQFHAELRIARQVSHKNVCRLYDLGEHEGRRFLTMEYVDGEDLATLLRRIGRLPHDKAVDIARQLCAGVAAAHERGVLHRDLKPANVMIDGDGNVRITDFGLAVAAGDITASRAGTPQYMAPELLTGGAPSVKTDIYALGLILFEMFTGKRAFDAKTFNELMSMHQTRTVATPSSMLRELDPSVERLIMRCLEHDAALRPGSALAVAAALPGGDPLAAALAAGETPSPEMIAAAGETTAFRPLVGISLFAAVIVGLITVATLSDRILTIARIPMEKSVDVLEDHARDLLAKLGYPDKPADSARGFLYLPDYLRYVTNTDRSATRWNGLSNPYAPTYRFWYRTSPRDLETMSVRWWADFDDPPMIITNMRLVVTDIAGHLTQFTNVPPQLEDAQNATAPPASMDWTVFFDAAGLDFGSFKPVPSRWVPNTYADERQAWEGPMPGRPDITIRAEAASYLGKPAFFQLAGPWSRTLRQTQDVPQGRNLIRFGFFLVVLALSIGTCVLARHNYRTGRGDHRGATRVAAAWIAITFAAWIVGSRVWLEPLTEFGHFIDDFAMPSLINAAILWLLYMALEPYVRRYSADILMSWSRLLSGRFRDPRVGRDILVGIVAGLGLAIVGGATALIPPMLGYPPPAPRNMNTEFLISTRRALAALLRMPPNALLNGMLITLAFALIRMAVKRTWLATVLTIVLGTFVIAGQSPGQQLWMSVVYAVVVSGINIGVLVNFGMLS
ncbi:MAG TPA: serine/threonine-protein kinase, partial [Vicinamibacterales bacterium]|nr:serine/threonine-protein kinase [Vicinamibacterales bacterium]